MNDIARQRLGAQYIAPPMQSTPAAIVAHLGAVQAQDYAGGLWAIGLRIAGATRADVERAITEKSIVRTWPMRGTLHFIPAMDARWMLDLLAPRIIKSVAGLFRQLELDTGTLKRSRNVITKALGQQPLLNRKEIYAALEKAGIGTGGLRGIHILRHLSMERVLCHGPHAEKQPTFALFDEWITSAHDLPRDEALRTIAIRYFTGHGPATLHDFVWWTGLTVADAKAAINMARPSLERVEDDGTEYWRGTERPGELAGAHLLPGYDEYMLGYRDRSAALPTKYAERIVPGANGVFLATLVLDGQVRGTWRRDAGPKGILIEASPFGRLSAQEKKAFTEPAERYAAYLGSPVTIAWER